MHLPFRLFAESRFHKPLLFPVRALGRATLACAVWVSATTAAEQASVAPRKDQHRTTAKSGFFEHFREDFAGRFDSPNVAPVAGETTENTTRVDLPVVALGVPMASDAPALEAALTSFEPARSPLPPLIDTTACQDRFACHALDAAWQNCVAGTTSGGDAEQTVPESGATIGSDGLHTAACQCPGCLAFAQQVAAAEVAAEAHAVVASSLPPASIQTGDETLDAGTDVAETTLAQLPQELPQELPLGDVADEEPVEEADRDARPWRPAPIHTLSIDPTPRRPQAGSSQYRTPDNTFAQQVADEYGLGGAVLEAPARPWMTMPYAWEAPSFYHRPLYFEDVNLERYGKYRGNWKCQSALSVAHFFGTLPTLPYQLGSNPPCRCEFTLGAGRPGNCNRHELWGGPCSPSGTVLHSLGITGLVFLTL